MRVWNKKKGRWVIARTVTTKKKPTRQLDGIVLFPLQNIQERIYESRLRLGLERNMKLV